MSGWTVPPNAAVPPGAGLEPPPGVGRPSRPEHEEGRGSAETRAEADAEAAQHQSSYELRKDAEHTREALNQDVVELRHKFGIDDEAKARRLAATGPLGPVRRHPFTVAFAAAGATTATMIGIKIARDHRKATKRYMKAAKTRRKAQQRFGDARDAVRSAAAELPHRRRSGLRRLVHR
ncbi:hypothetical protein L0U85_13810 [Glycomyces sp. L485]|uniref:hypothetical protein n=1 Tax=Glycomyces sp. L485 TaxID=2909235 RepID=UPI001F4A239F|nr:hypothetical protein [Glycomyces sp. L485]MCH7231920.1 hypothetical protein [Glycomyces sp. L485]